MSLLESCKIWQKLPKNYLNVQRITIYSCQEVRSAQRGDENMKKRRYFAGAAAILFLLLLCGFAPQSITEDKDAQVLLYETYGESEILVYTCLLYTSLAICMMIFCVPMGVFAAEAPSFSGGTGTQGDPWLIASQADLTALAEFLNSGNAETFDTENANVGNCHGYYFKHVSYTHLDVYKRQPCARRNATPCQNGDCGSSGGRDDGERGIVHQRSALRR